MQPAKSRASSRSEGSQSLEFESEFGLGGAEQDLAGSNGDT